MAFKFKKKNNSLFEKDMIRLKLSAQNKHSFQPQFFNNKL